MARGLLKALRLAGFEPRVASTFQSRDRDGDQARQADLITAAQDEAATVITTGQTAGWKAWITYHNYYKAPDLIGPKVARALHIPYVLIEATRARKRLTGPWARFAELAEEATDAADAVLYMTARDAEALQAYAPQGQIIRQLRPFLARDRLPPETNRSRSVLSVGMLRHGDKYASYELIAEALKHLNTPEWHLQIAGDGPARAQVEALMAPFDRHVSFLGALDDAGLEKAYGTHSILFWPGVNEAFGMTYLEAQAAGLAVVAQSRPGVTDVLAPAGFYPTPEQGAPALASVLDILLSDPGSVAQNGRAARRYIGETHMIESAANTLNKTLQEVLR